MKGIINPIKKFINLNIGSFKKYISSAKTSLKYGVGPFQGEPTENNSKLKMIYIGGNEIDVNKLNWRKTLNQLYDMGIGSRSINSSNVKSEKLSKGLEKTLTNKGEKIITNLQDNIYSGYQCQYRL